MRLLNTTTLELKEFFDTKAPKYAILSHRWGEDELSYQDYLEGSKRDTIGYAKINQFADLALSAGYDYVWIDTICIDKKSSAEVSEAINSMFRWYSRSAICYAYLSDVDEDHSMLEFDQSVWWQRGWTLQELLAPSEVIFCDRTWRFLAYKRHHSAEISQITGIPERTLLSLKSMYTTSIAMRMSWASRRQTTRKEDMAYCLMGLFDVNMPLLYGEGKKAFIRLQMEIIQKSADESIFAWTSPDPSWGMLAPDVNAFSNSGDIICYPRVKNKPYSMTNKGLKLRKTMLVQRAVSSKTFDDLRDGYRELLVLDCTKDRLQDLKNTSSNAKLKTRLTVCIENHHHDGRWVRVDCERLGAIDASLVLPQQGAIRFVLQPGR